MIACQFPLPMGFSRQEYRSGLPCPPPGDLPNPGIEPASLMSPALAGGFFIINGTWEKERYSHLNAEFQRIARRYKKAFLNDQCKEIEENNRMGKTRDLFKIIRDTKGTFHAKMGSIKDRNGMDLTEAEILRRGGKNTQNCTKKIFMTKIITMV